MSDEDKKIRKAITARIMETERALREGTDREVVLSQYKPRPADMPEEEWNEHLSRELHKMRQLSVKAPATGGQGTMQHNVRWEATRARLYVQYTDGRQIEFEWAHPVVDVEIRQSASAMYYSGMMLSYLPAPSDVEVVIRGPVSSMTEGVSAPFGGPMNVSVGTEQTHDERLLNLLRTLRDGSETCPACEQSPCAPGCKLTEKVKALSKREEKP